MKKRQEGIWFGWPVLLGGLLVVFGGLTLSAIAHENEHGHPKGMSEHMKAMYRVKEMIPEEYRVMDRSPVTPTEETLKRGRELYLEHCAVCHGKEGRGDGPAASGMNPPPADFQDLEHSSVYGPGEKYWIIGNGSPETGMPGFAARIEPEDRWHLVNHILALQESRKASGAKRP